MEEVAQWKVMMGYMLSAIVVLGTAIAALWLDMKSRRKKDDEYREKEAERTNNFTTAVLTIAKAVENNTKALHDNTEAVQIAFHDQQLNKRRR